MKNRNWHMLVSGWIAVVVLVLSLFAIAGTVERGSGYGSFEERDDGAFDIYVDADGSTWHFNGKLVEKTPWPEKR